MAKIFDFVFPHNLVDVSVYVSDVRVVANALRLCTGCRISEFFGKAVNRAASDTVAIDEIERIIYAHTPIPTDEAATAMRSRPPTAVVAGTVEITTTAMIALVSVAAG